MAKIVKLNKNWIRRTKSQFRSFLVETGFPDPDRMGSRGPEFSYPEWLIMFVAVLAVKCKVKTYLELHGIVSAYWKEIGGNLPLISERQLRDRIKKIGCTPRRAPAFVFQAFSEGFFSNNSQC